MQLTAFSPVMPRKRPSLSCLSGIEYLTNPNLTAASSKLSSFVSKFPATGEREVPVVSGSSPDPPSAAAAAASFSLSSLMTQNFSLLGAGKPTLSTTKTNPLLNFLPSFSSSKFPTTGANFSNATTPTFNVTTHSFNSTTPSFNSTTPSFVTTSQPSGVEPPKPDLQMQTLTR